MAKKSVKSSKKKKAGKTSRSKRSVALRNAALELLAPGPAGMTGQPKFAVGDRVQTTAAKTFGSVVIPAGSCGTVVGVSPHLSPVVYAVKIDGDSHAQRLYFEGDLKAGCTTD